MKTEALRKKKRELESKIQVLDASIEKLERPGIIWVPRNESEVSQE
jgi:hypothetical protein